MSRATRSQVRARNRSETARSAEGVSLDGLTPSANALREVHVVERIGEEPALERLRIHLSDAARGRRNGGNRGTERLVRGEPVRLVERGGDKQVARSHDRRNV